MTEIHTTVKNGLDVIARGRIETCHPNEYPGCDTIEDFEILWPSGCIFGPKVSKEDEQRVCDELFEASRDRYYGAGV